MNRKAKIVIVDDHEMFREGMKLFIETEGIGEVVAEAENGQQFLDILENHMPDLVIMDIEMPVMGGLEATTKAIAIRSYLKILVLTLHCRKEDCNDLINAGVMGFVLKTSGKQELEKAIKTVIAGNKYFSDEQSNNIKINLLRQ
ncbi:MAG TPA: response regulator transcription factor [Paludibacter sp.]